MIIKLYNHHVNDYQNGFDWTLFDILYTDCIQDLAVRGLDVDAHEVSHDLVNNSLQKLSIFSVEVSDANRVDIRGKTLPPAVNMFYPEDDVFFQL